MQFVTILIVTYFWFKKLVMTGLLPSERVSSVEKEEEHSKKEEFWSIASQMKLLVDTPEKIWNAMENKQFLIGIFC